MVIEPPAPALIEMEPPGPQVISTAALAPVGSQVIFRLPAVWSTATPIFPSPVCNANADLIAGEPPIGGSSSLNTSRLPAPLTKPRRTTCALIPVVFTASPPRIAELEADQHFVADLGGEQRPRRLPAAELGHPRPVRLVRGRQPGQRDLDPTAGLRVVVVGDDAAHQAGDAGRLALGGAERGEPEQRAFLPPADEEPGSVAALRLVE